MRYVVKSLAEIEDDQIHLFPFINGIRKLVHLGQQLRRARNPCWQSVKILFSSRCPMTLLVMMCSCILQH